jgi:Cu/Ag efflux protein CusF
MKAILTRKMMILGLALGLGVAGQVFGDTPAGASKEAATSKEKTVKGVATSIDPAEKTVSVRNFWGTKRLNVADDCKVSLQDKTQASLPDLHPGQRVEINYEEAQGVLVAHQIAQRNVTFTGHVKALDPEKHSLTLRGHTLDKTFVIADDCKVVLRDEKTGALANLQPGHRVTVVYETPNGTATVRQIAQTSETFSGALTAIDLNDRTLKAKAFLNGKKFNVANDCAIVISGKPDARLSDLKLGDKLVFSYDDVNGVNIVNRIATAEPTPEPPTTASGERHDTGMPMMPPY